MHFIIKTTPEELLRAKKWWNDLEMQWKMAYNESVFGLGASVAPPADDHLMLLLTNITVLRFAGPTAYNPNLSMQLTNLSGLAPMHQLTYLSFTNSLITGIQEISHLKKMEHLFINDNKINSLVGIEAMQNLKELYVQGNQVESLMPLQNLKNLETVYASGNKLTNFDGITEAHAEKMKHFRVLPNEGIRDRAVIQFQNTVGIICKQG